MFWNLSNTVKNCLSAFSIETMLSYDVFSIIMIMFWFILRTVSSFTYAHITSRDLRIKPFSVSVNFSASAEPFVMVNTERTSTLSASWFSAFLSLRSASVSGPSLYRLSKMLHAASAVVQPSCMHLLTLNAAEKIPPLSASTSFSSSFSSSMLKMSFSLLHILCSSEVFSEASLCKA